MAHAQRHAEADRLAEPGILRGILIAGYDMVTRTVVDILQRPLGFRLEVKPRPIWLHILAFFSPLVLLLLAPKLFAQNASSISGPPETTVTHDVQAVATYPTMRQYQVPGLDATELPYTPKESGVVAESCFLVSEISTLTARAPGAQNLHEFVGISLKSTTAQSRVLASQDLSGFCLESRAKPPMTGERKANAARSKWEKAEAEHRWWIRMRTKILLSDPASAAVYQRLFLDGTDSESYSETTRRVASLCSPFWR